MVAPAVERPVIGEAASRRVLYQHFVINPDLLELTISRSFKALYARVAEAGVIPMGPPFVIFCDASVPGVRWDMQICIPVSAPVTETLEFKYRELPATRVVSILHVGAYDTIGGAYRAIDDYIAEHHLTPTGAPREFYLSPPNVPAHQTRTLVERPIAD